MEELILFQNAVPQNAVPQKQLLLWSKFYFLFP